MYKIQQNIIIMYIYNFCFILLRVNLMHTLFLYLDFFIQKKNLINKFLVQPALSLTSGGLFLSEILLLSI